MTAEQVDPDDALSLFKEIVNSGALGDDLTVVKRSIEDLDVYNEGENGETMKLSDFAKVIRRHAITVDVAVEIVRSRARRFPEQRDWLGQLVFWLEEGAS